jgi:hypothetical protein
MTPPSDTTKRPHFLLHVGCHNQRALRRMHGVIYLLLDALRAPYFIAGAARRLVTFLASPRKVTQRRRAPSTAPSGFPALLVKPGGCGTRAARSDSPRRLPPACLRCSAVDRGEFGEAPGFCVTPVVLVSHRFPLLRRFVLAGKLGAVGCALFELRDSPRFVRAVRASCADAQLACQHEGTRRAAQGVAFSWLPSFGEAKEVTRSPGGPGTKSSMRKAHTQTNQKSAIATLRSFNKKIG